MVDELDISSTECVVALTELGFLIARRTAGTTVLRRGDQLAIVPDAVVLAHSVLERILETADLTFEELEELVAEAPTVPDLGPLLPNH
jgi:hypothetical protein